MTYNYWLAVHTVAKYAAVIIVSKVASAVTHHSLKKVYATLSNSYHVLTYNQPNEVYAGIRTIYNRPSVILFFSRLIFAIIWDEMDSLLSFFSETTLEIWLLINVLAFPCLVPYFKYWIVSSSLFKYCILFSDEFQIHSSERSINKLGFSFIHIQRRNCGSSCGNK